MKTPPRPDPSEQRDRLIGLGPEVLADTLIRLALQDDSANNAVVRLTASKGALVDRVESQISAVNSRRSGYYDNNSTRLESILEDIATAASDNPRQGVELCLRFFELDEAAMENGNSDDWDIQSLFEHDAHALFLMFAARCPDKDWLIDAVLQAVSHDEYGVRGVLLSSVTPFLDDERTRSLIGRLRMSGGSPAVSSTTGRLYAIQLAIELGDPYLVEELAIEHFGEIPDSVRVDIARVHHESGCSETALEWLEPISGQAARMDSILEPLLFEVHRALGHVETVTEMAWGRLHGDRSRRSLEGLLGVIGEDQRESVLAGEIALIYADPAFSSHDLEFLIEVGLLQQAADYVTRRYTDISGSEWYRLAPAAATLDQNGFALAATCLYRALTRSILERKQTRAYHHGADYMLRLKQLDRSIIDRHGIGMHVDFEAELRREHGRKWSFWQKIGG